MEVGENVKTGTVVQRNGQGEVDGKTVLETYNTFSTYAEAICKQTNVCTGTIVEVETVSDNGLLPLVNAINGDVVAKTP